MADTSPISPRVLARFNLAPLDELDPSWSADVPIPDLATAATSSPRVSAYVARYMLKAADIAERYVTDFRRPRARIALMDRDALQSLLLHVGAALRSADFRREIDRERVLATRDAVGEALHDFAIRTAPLYGDLPSVDVAARDIGLRERCMLVGAIFSVDRIALQEAGYRQRLSWKLPKPVAEHLARVAEARESDDAPELPPLLRRIINDRFGSWRPLFDG